MKHGLPFLLFAICLLSHGQLLAFPIDSLRIPAIISEINDSIRYYQDKDSLKTINYIKEVEDLAIKHQSDQLKAYADYYKGRLYSDFTNNDLAETYFQSALKKTLALGYTDQKLLSSIYDNYSYFKLTIGETKESKEYGWLAYQYTQHLGDDVEMATSSFNIAYQFSIDGNFKDALRFMDQALEYDLKLNDSIAISTDYSFLGSMYFLMKDYDQTLANYKKAISYVDRKKEPINYAGLLSKYADAAVSANLYDKAIDLSQEAIDIFKEFDQPASQMIPKIHRAHAKFYQGLKEQAWLELYEVYDYTIKNDLKYSQIRCLYIMGKIEENSTLAVEHLAKAADLATELNHNTYRSVIHQILNSKLNLTAFDDMNLKYSKMYIDLLEEKNEANLKTLTSGMDTKFQLYTMNELNMKLELDAAKRDLIMVNRRTRTTLYLSLLIVLLAAAIAVLFFTKQRQQIQVLRHKDELNELEDRLAELINRSDNKIVLPAFEELNNKLDNRLTNKEYEVLSDLVLKKTNKEIAAAHFISINTVKFHLKNIYAKLDAPNKKRVMEKIQKIEG